MSRRCIASCVRRSSPFSEISSLPKGLVYLPTTLPSTDTTSIIGSNEAALVPADMQSLSTEFPGVLATVIKFLDLRGCLTVRTVCIGWRDASLMAGPTIRIANSQSLGHLSTRLASVRQILPRTEEFAIVHEGPQETLPPGFFHPFVTEYLRSVFLCMDNISSALPHPYLFQISNVRMLDLFDARWLEWDLAMLSGLPQLESLRCMGSQRLTGDLSSVRSSLSKSLTHLTLFHCPLVAGSLDDVQALRSLSYLCLDGCDRIVGSLDVLHSLRGTLTNLCLYGCSRVTGSLNDLRDFRLLQKFDVRGTAVDADLPQDNLLQGEFSALQVVSEPTMLHAPE